MDTNSPTPDTKTPLPQRTPRLFQVSLFALITGVSLLLLFGISTGIFLGKYLYSPKPVPIPSPFPIPISPSILPPTIPFSSLESFSISGTFSTTVTEDNMGDFAQRLEPFAVEITILTSFPGQLSIGNLSQEKCLKIHTLLSSFPYIAQLNDCRINEESSNQNKPDDENVTTLTKQSTVCGGWDTSGEVVCQCKGQLTKQVCPSGVVCDSGDYFCDGVCGSCCYKGIAQNSKYPKCSQ